MEKEIFDSLSNLQEAFKQVGSPLYTREYLAKLLAYVTITGREEFTLDPVLFTSIKIAQNEFNIKGGKVPDLEGVLLINQYKKELESKPTPEWVRDLEKRYRLKPYNF